jgi:hypothetical protein
MASPFGDDYAGSASVRSMRAWKSRKPGSPTYFATMRPLLSRRYVVGVTLTLPKARAIPPLARWAIIQSTIAGESMMRLVSLMIGLVLAAPAWAQLENITDREAINALKSALDRGARAAVAQLGRENGFLGDARVKIPLPESLRRAEKNMRRFGMGKYADELIVTLNRAAEAAVPEAKQLFVDALRQMSVQDAKGILTGGETAATEYFRRVTAQELAKRFLPIVRRATARVGLAQKYNQYARHGVRVGLVEAEDANLDDYVTRKALDGLYFVVAEEERKIRKDPVGAASGLIRKVFGALL